MFLRRKIRSFTSLVAVGLNVMQSGGGGGSSSSSLLQAGPRAGTNNLAQLDPHPVALRLHTLPANFFGDDFTADEEERLDRGESLDDYPFPWAAEQEFICMPWGYEPADFVEKLTLRLTYPTALKGHIGQGRACYSLTLQGVRYYYSATVSIFDDPADTSKIKLNDLWFEGVVVVEQEEENDNEKQLLFACSCFHRVEPAIPPELWQVPQSHQSVNAKVRRTALPSLGHHHHHQQQHPRETPIQCSVCHKWHHPSCTLCVISPSTWRCGRSSGCHPCREFVRFLQRRGNNGKIRPCSQLPLLPRSFLLLTPQK